MAHWPFKELSKHKSMRLVPWKIEGEAKALEEVEVLYNPKEYTVEFSNKYSEIEIPGLQAPIVQFIQGNSEKLNFDLLVDTTDKEFGSNDRNAATVVEKIMKLALISGARHAPPVVKFQWSDLELDGVIESVRRQFVLFDPDGTPTRANVTLAIKRYRTLVEQLGKMNLQSRDRTHSVEVREHDTLPRIAARMYGDDALWREIANKNDIADPARLEPGQVLRIPAIEGT